MYRKFKESMLREFALPRPGTAVMAAFSGGADSLCLLDMLIRLREERGDFKLCAQHQQHMIRGIEAEEDLAFCRAFCKEHDVVFYADYCNVPEWAAERRMNLEEAARLVRRASWSRHREAFARRGIKLYIALAHHAGDQAETFLLRLERGSGPAGLAGMRRENEGFIRPLLDFERKDIENYLAERGLSYRTDRSNEDTAYRRNFLRRVLLPLWQKEADESLVRRIAQAASLLQEEESLLRPILEKHLQELKCYPTEPFFDPGLQYYSCKVFRSFTAAEQNALLNLILQHEAGLRDYTAQHIREMNALISVPAGEKALHLPGGCELVTDGERFYFKPLDYLLEPDFPAAEKEGFCRDLAELRDGVEELPSGWKLFFLPSEKKAGERGLLLYNELSEFCVRTRRGGDYCLLKNGRKTALKDFLAKQRVPLSLRGRILFLCRGSEVLNAEALRETGLNSYQNVKIAQSGEENTECFKLIWYNSRNK